MTDVTLCILDICQWSLMLKLVSMELLEGIKSESNESLL